MPSTPAVPGPHSTGVFEKVHQDVAASLSVTEMCVTATRNQNIHQGAEYIRCGASMPSGCRREWSSYFCADMERFRDAFSAKYSKKQNSAYMNTFACITKDSWKHGLWDSPPGCEFLLCHLPAMYLGKPPLWV